MQLPKQLCVAVVDDNEAMRDIVFEMLRSFGLSSFVVASNGVEALKKMSAHHPHVVITDCHMQPMGGLAMTRMIRHAQVGLNPVMPILAMVGQGEDQLAAQARDAGVSEFLMKPIKTDALLAGLHESIENPRLFVRGGDFYGPDRRRRNLGPIGAERRRLQPSILYQPSTTERASHLR